MKTFIKWIILASFLVNVGSTYGDSAPAISLLKGDKAPFDGILFTIEYANKTRLDLIEYDRATRLNAVYEKDIALLETRVDHWRSTSESLSNRVIEADNRSYWQNAGYFALGAVTVILLAFATSKATGSN
jgi:hypothetical protein